MSATPGLLKQIQIRAQATLDSGIVSLESIPGLLKRLQIRAQATIPWNRFLGSIKVLKIPPLFVLLRSSSFFSLRSCLFLEKAEFAQLRFFWICGINRLRSASFFRICGINRLPFASICLICGINRFHSASIFRICGINRIHFASLFLRCRISRVRFASIFTSSGKSRFVSLQYWKWSQDRSFVPPLFRYRCRYY